MNDNCRVYCYELYNVSSGFKFFFQHVQDKQVQENEIYISKASLPSSVKIAT